MSEEIDDYQRIKWFLQSARDRLRILAEEDLVWIIPEDMGHLGDLFRRTWGHADYILHQTIVAIPQIPYDKLEGHGLTGDHIDLKIKEVDVLWNRVSNTREVFKNLQQDERNELRQKLRADRDLKSRIGGLLISDWKNLFGRLKKNWHKFLRGTDACVFDSLGEVLNSISFGGFGLVKEAKNCVEIALEPD